MFRLLIVLPLSIFGIYWSLPPNATGNASWYHWMVLAVSLFALKLSRFPLNKMLYKYVPQEEACLLNVGGASLGIFWALQTCAYGGGDWYHWVALVVSLWCLMPGPLPMVTFINGQQYPPKNDGIFFILEDNPLVFFPAAYGIYWALQTCASGGGDWYHWLVLFVSLRFYTFTRNQPSVTVDTEHQPPEEGAGVPANLPRTSPSLAERAAR